MNVPTNRKISGSANGANDRGERHAQRDGAGHAEEGHRREWPGLLKHDHRAHDRGRPVRGR
jgi:hypothetical protein